MWEYKIFKASAVDFAKSENKITEELNKLGSDGWELASTFTGAGGGILGASGGAYLVTLLFKRPLK